MGSWCSACSPDEAQKHQDVEPPQQSNIKRKGEQNKYIQYSDNDMDDMNDTEPDTDDTGYENSLSHSSNDDDDKFQALTDHDREQAIEGWKKAIDSGNETLATYFFEEFPTIDMFSYLWDNGATALHIACKNKKARLVFFLLTQGANVNQQNIKTRDTALHHSVRIRDEKVIKLLLQWDADPDVMNKQKQSPKTISSQYRDKDIFNMLCGGDDADDIQQRMNRQKSTADRMADIASQMLYDAQDGNVDDRSSQSKSQSKHDAVLPPSQPQLSDEQSQKLLERERVAKLNPFNQMKRRNTKQSVLNIKKNLKQKPLPKLEAWLEKKKPGGGIKTYQRRWCIVRGAHLLWSAKQRSITNDADRKERKKFNGSIHLMTIESINPVKTTSNNKFTVKAKDQKRGAMREYIFRCTNKKERDFWLNGLKEHKKQYQQVLHYLGR